MTSDDGSVTIELVLVTPVLLLLLAFVVMTGRLGEAGQAVTHAAQQAARAASIRDDAGTATTDAERVATANLESLGLSCSALSVVVDVTRLRPAGDVTVDVTCTVDLADVAFAGIPGSRTLHARAVEVIDTFRGAG